MFIKCLNKRTINTLNYFFKWLLISSIISIFSGSASALFLISLHFVENLRFDNTWLFYFLPLVGGIIGLFYFYWGKDIAKGNNLIIEEFHEPKRIVPLKMAPMVLLGTLLTHLVGGSAGREGTAVQMSGALSDQLNKWFKFSENDRKIILLIGVSAGFSSVFGTPLAGAIFALEIMIFKGEIKYDAIFPSFISALFADFVCGLWGVKHTSYLIFEVPDFDWLSFFWCCVLGLFFGLAAYGFKQSMYLFKYLFKCLTIYEPLKPILGGIILLLVYLFFNTQKFAGLGIEVIQNAFVQSQDAIVFIGKILFTTFTLSAGFKGGEVTPLFFIGAALGSFLFVFIPLPLSLLAALGFVAVFAGATHTPIACIVMGLELFGVDAALYFVICVWIAHRFSGKNSIYTAQKY
jgi:H+/Cl- antiporter ClcA